MADETTLAATPGENTTVVDDGVIDLDAPATADAKDGDGQEPKGKTEDAGDKPDGEEQPKKPSGAQRAKIREARLLSELQAREREIEDLKRSQPAPTAAGEKEDKPPREEDFGDWFAWQRAMTAHEAGKAAKEAIRGEFKTREDSDRSTKQAEIVRERAIAHAERVEDARETITDFDQVMTTMKGVNVRNEVIDEIMSSDKSALLSYYLAKNPEKLQALDRLSGRELAREMGRLEGSIRMPAAKKQTAAPTPLNPLKGGASGSFDPEKASMDDYVAKRNAGWKG